MIETRGIGYEEPRGYFTLDHEIEPTYTLIQFGSDQPWNWPDRGGFKPGYKTIGMVTFDANGLQQAAVLEHGAVNQLQTEVQVWRDKENAGWPMPQNQDEYTISIFIGKYLQTFPDISAVETRRKYPQHLPLPNGPAVLCCTELRPWSQYGDDVPGEWLKLIGVKVDEAYGAWMQSQVSQGAE